VAHFLYSALEGKPLTIYGDGRQVRDVLCVKDLVLAFEKVRAQMEKTAGQIYNVGGGIKNSVSLLEVIEMIEEVTGKQVRYTLQRPRPGDQLFYVTDFEKLTQHTGWKPKISVRQNLHLIWNWWKEQRVLPVQTPVITTAPAALAHAPEAAS
jgi:CDP-paratose 2-epimerase